jgi:uncharacterized protein (UPF0332 family)
MTVKPIQALINKAESKLQSAKTNLKYKQYDDSISRSYYAIYHAISAILLHKGFAFSSHSQTIGAFNREFVKNKIFTSDFSMIINELFKFRQIGDYDALSAFDEETASRCLSNAERIVKEIKKYLIKRNVE